MKLVVAFAAIALAFPSLALADDPCAGSDLCRADRPRPHIDPTPRAPRNGGALVLRVTPTGRGSTLAWDLDGDGAFDDAGGETVRTFFFGGRVAVRETDQFGRSGVDELTLAGHAFNVRPAGSLTIAPLAPRAGHPVTVTANGSDPDGQLAKTELDLDGDGTFEFSGAERALTFPATGTRTVRARFTDDTGAISISTATLDVHTANLAPRVSVQAINGNGSMQIGAPLIAGDAIIRAYGSDPDGRIAGFDFDLDGNGSYEAHADPRSGFPLGDLGDARTVFAAGDHEIGVRVTDSDGATATLRRTVSAVASLPVGSQQPPTLVLDFAGTVARPGVPVSLYAYASGGSVAWDTDDDGEFDDGTGTPRSVTFPAAGEYTVRVKASNAYGERVALSTVSVREAPDLAPVLTDFALPTAVRGDRPAYFSPGASAADGTGALTPVFDLDGDGDFDDSPGGPYSFSWTFPAPVTIAAKVTDGAGRSAVRTADVAPYTGNLGPYALWLQLPGVSVPVDPGYIAGRAYNLAIGLYDSDNGGCCTPAWDLDGDGAYDDSSNGSITHTFSAGEQTIGVRVVDADGAVSTDRSTFSVGTRVPQASFTANGATLTSTAGDPDGDPLTIQWDLDGNRRFDDAYGPTARPLPGEHLVGVKATDPSGEIGLSYARVTGDPLPDGPSVVPAPTATPTPTPGPPVAPPPLLVTATVKAVKLSALLSRGVAVGVSCTRSCHTTVVATIDAKLAKKLKLRTREVGRGTGTVKLTAKARKALKAQRTLKLTLTVTATGADGARATTKKTVTIRR